MVIPIAGPYCSGTGDNPEKMAENVRHMEAHALPIFRLGHIQNLYNKFFTTLNTNRKRLSKNEGLLF
jgi:hypothetical protein